MLLKQANKNINEKKLEILKQSYLKKKKTVQFSVLHYIMLKMMIFLIMLPEFYPLCKLLSLPIMLWLNRKRLCVN